MDNFDNFFNKAGDGGSERTPVYHTPDSTGGGPNKKMTTVTILFVVIAVIMCIAIVANVIVLASMKSQVSQDYADTLTNAVRDQYLAAIEEYLDGREITDDVLEQIKEDVIKALNTSAAAVAGTETIYSTAQIVAGGKSPVSGTGFLITATDSSGNSQRYVVTNAHVVLEVRSSTSSGGGILWGGGSSTTYSFATRSNITCSFMDGASGSYSLEVVAVGSYYETENGQVVDSDYKTESDLAILRFTGDQPDETTYPSLNIASDEADYGDNVAIVGYPEGAGLSVTSGTISKTANQLSRWGYGSFYMTDAAINSGNSGGPMVNNKGEVVGVVESKLSSTDGSTSIENMGYAVTSMTLIEFLSSQGLTPVTV